MLEAGPWALGGTWAQARAQGPGAQGMPKAQGPASSTDANALALIHDDNIIHMSAIPNPIIECLCIGPSKGCPKRNISPYVQLCVKGLRTFPDTLIYLYRKEIPIADVQTIDRTGSAWPTCPAPAHMPPKNDSAEPWSPRSKSFALMKDQDDTKSFKH